MGLIDQFNRYSKHLHKAWVFVEVSGKHTLEGSLMGKPVIPISRLDFATAFIPSTLITLNLTKFSWSYYILSLQCCLTYEVTDSINHFHAYLYTTNNQTATYIFYIEVPYCPFWKNSLQDHCHSNVTIGLALFVWPILLTFCLRRELKGTTHYTEQWNTGKKQKVMAR